LNSWVECSFKFNMATLNNHNRNSQPQVQQQNIEVIFFFLFVPLIFSSLLFLWNLLYTLLLQQDQMLQSQDIIHFLCYSRVYLSVVNCDHRK
jgi:hypothetical protein